MRNIEIPNFIFNQVFIEPWAEFPFSTFWIVMMGFLVSAACGLVGVFLVLRKISLVGDAISHSVLPGIALAFLLAQSRATLPMFIGAILAGVLTVVLIEWIQKSSPIKADAAIGIVFSSLFAVGVILITVFAGQVDLDTECVLYGEIAFVPLEPLVSVAFFEGPVSAIRMGFLLLGVIFLLGLFYKEVLVTSFDPGLSASLGISPAIFHFGLMILLSLVVVGAFESVGAILVIAMLIFPGATGMLWSDRLKVIMFLVPLWAIMYALGGFHLATWLNISIAGSMTLIAGLVFGLSWMFAPKRGLISKLIPNGANEFPKQEF